MIILGVLTFLLSTNTNAIPLPVPLPPPFFTRAETPCQCPSDNSRSTIDIIWSCIATMFACTWVAVHPNIPADDETWFEVARRRAKLMFWAVISPEMIIFWAMRQWVNARKMAEMYENKGWTKSHGFFLQMGGFVLYDGKNSLGPLSLTRFRDLLSKDQIDFPDITVAQIQDRSKGDLLAKGIVFIQTSWFAIQCLARGIQGIGITELELVTLAFAVLNGIMYFFWWDKPLDVRCPVAVQLKVKESSGSISEGEEEMASQSSIVDRPSAEEDDQGGNKQENEKSQDDVTVDIEIAPISTADKALEAQPSELSVNEILPADLSTIHAVSEKQSDEIIARRQRWTKSLHKILDILWIILTLGLIDLLRPLDDMTQSPVSITLPPSMPRVPTFYAELAPPSVLYGLDIPSAVISLVFGGIHCIGLLPHFPFPSEAEKILWRTCSILITCIPIPFLLLSIMLYYKVHWRPPGIGRTLFHLFKRGIYISLVLYIIARLALLVQAFVALRALPDDALVAVDWTSFFPHV